MPRVEITEIIALSTTGQGIDGAVVTLNQSNDITPAVAYPTETSLTPLVQPVTSDNGRIILWVDEGTYVLHINPSVTGPNFTPQRIKVEAVSGEAVVNARGTGDFIHIIKTGTYHSGDTIVIPEFELADNEIAFDLLVSLRVSGFNLGLATGPFDVSITFTHPFGGITQLRNLDVDTSIPEVPYSGSRASNSFIRSLPMDPAERVFDATVGIWDLGTSAPPPDSTTTVDIAFTAYLRKLQI